MITVPRAISRLEAEMMSHGIYFENPPCEDVVIDWRVKRKTVLQDISGCINTLDESASLLPKLWMNMLSLRYYPACISTIGLPCYMHYAFRFLNLAGIAYLHGARSRWPFPDSPNTDVAPGVGSIRPSAFRLTRRPGFDVASTLSTPSTTSAQAGSGAKERTQIGKQWSATWDDSQIYNTGLLLRLAQLSVLGAQCFFGPPTDSDDYKHNLTMVFDPQTHPSPWQTATSLLCETSIRVRPHFEARALSWVTLAYHQQVVLVSGQRY
jgi:hypothetical protein